jgi:hypothetical protein
MKEAATVIAIIIASIGYIPYIRDSLQGKTKPHIISWFTWALISFLAFGVQLLNGGGVGSYVNLFMGGICTTVFIIGLHKGTRNITRIDVIAFALAIIAIVLWLIVKQPLWSMVLVIFIDIMSFFPTIRKSWNKPWDETLITYECTCVKNLFSIYALQSYTLITTSYPIYSLIATFLFVLLLIFRRKVVKRPASHATTSG